MGYQFDLLQELCTICKENQIDYYLYGTLMQAAYDQEEVDPNWDSYDIAVTGAGFRKLEGILTSKDFVDSHPNRALESLLTNPHFPGFHANYVATDTLRFDFRNDINWYQHKGLPIHVLIIANRDQNTRKARMTSRLRDAYLRIVHKRRGFREWLFRLFYGAIFAVGGSSFKKRLFNNYLNSWKSASKASGLYLADGRYSTFKKNFWKKNAEKTLDGVVFSVPQKCLRKKVYHRLYNLDVIHSETMSYDEFCEMCRKQNIDLQQVYQQRLKQFRAMRLDLKQGRRDKKYYNSAFYSTSIRRDVSRRAAQCEVRSLESPEYYELMEEYLGYIVKHQKNGVTPYITQGLYMDAMKVLLQNNQEGYQSSRKTVYNMMIKYANKIPDHYFLKTDVVADACYSADEAGKDAVQLRKELEEKIHDLVWSEEPQEDENEEES